MSLQIVLHRFRMPDGWACDTFGPPGAARPFHIVVRPGEFGADARLQALTLGEMLHAELVKIYENPRSAECPGVTDDPQEHLIVLTSNGIIGTIFDDLPFHGRRILLVLPASLQSQAVALSALIGSGRLASFWTSSLAEVIPAILANAGITWERPRIFISYRRDDTQGLAAQLFHALAEENFDVFLDQFRLPPGLELLARIRQELGDKTMVVVLESANLRDSPWVRYEVRVAQTLRLGLLAVTVPGGSPLPGIDAARRQTIRPEDFTRGGLTRRAVLRKRVLKRVVAEIQTQHDRAVALRRQQVVASMRSALLLLGIRDQFIDAYGRLHVRTGSPGSPPQREYVVWLASKPPELSDFHRANCPPGPAGPAIVIGIGRLLEPARAEQTAWLGQIANTTFRDEGLINQTAQDIASGIL